MLVNVRRVVLAMSSAAWRTSSEEFRSGVVAGVRAATVDSGKRVRVVTSDGVQVTEFAAES